MYNIFYIMYVLFDDLSTTKYYEVLGSLQGLTQGIQRKVRMKEKGKIKIKLLENWSILLIILA